MQQGTVATKTPKGFGFIKVDGASANDKDLFFHSKELVNISFDDLQEGDTVSFEVSNESPKGPSAVKVSKV